MAKSKKSRRMRREQIEKQRQESSAAPSTSESSLSGSNKGTAVAPEPVQTAPASRRAVADFAQTYYYVYTEMRSILMVAVVMFIVMIGLSFLI